VVAKRGIDRHVGSAFVLDAPEVLEALSRDESFAVSAEALVRGEAEDGRRGAGIGEMGNETERRSFR